MKRMVIERYVPPAPPAIADGLPPMIALPAADGRMQITFIGKRSFVDAWSSESLIRFARQFGRTCAAALDVEIAVLKAERDALKTRLDEIEGR